MSLTPSPTSRLALLAVSTAVAGAGALTSLTTLSHSPALADVPSTLRIVAAAAEPVPLPVPVPVPAPASALLEQQRGAGLDCSATPLGTPVCTHAPHEVASDGGGAATGTKGRLGCYGDGTSGPRVRAVYARAEGAADRYAASLPSIRAWAAGISQQFDASAGRTKGRRHVRFATTPGPSCELAVLPVVLPASAFRTFGATVDALEAQGLRAPHSKYLVWADASGYCGMATTYADDRPGLDNLNNAALPGYARIDRRCWGKVETHELLHMLGGVQRSARNATGGFHCNDGSDVMCYADGTSRSAQRSVCPRDQAALLDCRNDDYYSTAAPRGSYLQTHWNTARSSFLAPALTDPPRPAATPSASGGPSPRPTTTAAPSPRPTATAGGLPVVPALPLPRLTPSVPALLDALVTR